MSTEIQLPLIGAIADDFTGATDVAVAFRNEGLHTVIFFGLPPSDANLPPADAVVIALKSRTIEVDEARRQSLEAASWLRSKGAARLFFKFCSTFDSTPRGNIGPVLDALADYAGASLTTVIPSSPGHGRRQYMGRLFVGQQLLDESPMRHHPLTPMKDSFIPRVLASQTDRQVGLLDHPTVLQGCNTIKMGLANMQLRGDRYAVVDAVTTADLKAIGEAIADDPLVTGAAGIARGVAAALARGGGLTATNKQHDADPTVVGPSVVLAGSCSARTLEQISAMQRKYPSHHLDALLTPDSRALADTALAWFDAMPHSDSTLIYSSLPSAELRKVQEALGAERASRILEEAMARIAQGLIQRDVRRLVVAGGETSGAVVSALKVQGGIIGREAAPGVPWIYTAGNPQRALLLKSGNLGDPDLLVQAAEGGSVEAVLS